MIQRNGLQVWLQTSLQPPRETWIIRSSRMMTVTAVGGIPHLADPHKVRLIAESTIKTDTVDATVPRCW